MTFFEPFWLAKTMKHWFKKFNTSSKTDNQSYIQNMEIKKMCKKLFLFTIPHNKNWSWKRKRLKIVNLWVVYKSVLKNPISEILDSKGRKILFCKYFKSSKSNCRFPKLYNWNIRLKDHINSKNINQTSWKF